MIPCCHVVTVLERLAVNEPCFTFSGSKMQQVNRILPRFKHGYKLIQTCIIMYLPKKATAQTECTFQKKGLLTELALESGLPSFNVQQEVVEERDLSR